MIWIVAIGIILEAISVYIIWNLLKKTEVLEDNLQDLEKNIVQYELYYEDLKRRVNESQSQLKQIDRLGSFESDDETGTIFKQLKRIVNELNERF